MVFAGRMGLHRIAQGQVRTSMNEFLLQAAIYLGAGAVAVQRRRPRDLIPVGGPVAVAVVEDEVRAEAELPAERWALEAAGPEEVEVAVTGGAVEKAELVAALRAHPRGVDVQHAPRPALALLRCASRVLAYLGRDASTFFSDVVKNVAAANMELKKCVGQTPFDVADPDVLR